MKGLIHGISLGGWDLAIAEKARGLMGVAKITKRLQTISVKIQVSELFLK